MVCQHMSLQNNPFSNTNAMALAKVDQFFTAMVMWNKLVNLDHIQHLDTQLCTNGYCVIITVKSIYSEIIRDDIYHNIIDPMI